MNSDLQTAFLLLLVGMITVFIILSLVVLSARLLIWATNRFHRDLPDFSSQRAAAAGTDRIHPTRQELAAIVAAVETVTEGSGRIERIERITDADVNKP